MFWPLVWQMCGSSLLLSPRSGGGLSDLSPELKREIPVLLNPRKLWQEAGKKKVLIAWNR